MLEVVDLAAGYASARVLDDISLQVQEGEVLAVLGRNGMGKTTLLRAICGLRPPVVASGSIRFRGHDLARLPTHEIVRAGISLVPQGRRVFPSLTVAENLVIAARRRASGWDQAAVYDMFPRLRERSGQRAGTLSGGEQQMLAIGRALMTNPELIVMDEPSEGLSPAMVDQVADRIRDVRSRGHGVLLAEQNVDLALSVADRVAVIGDGGVLSWTGQPDTLRADDALVAHLVGLQAAEEVAQI
jgi:branched-chain amino acid transport system ATP-binding protein